MHNATATEAQEGSCTFAPVNYCLSLVVAKMFRCEGSAATRDKQYRLLTKLAQAALSPVKDSIGEIHKSVHNHYSELHF